MIVKGLLHRKQEHWSVYYRLYLDNVSGGLADMLEITVTDGDSRYLLRYSR